MKQWIYCGDLPAVKLPNGYWRIKHADLAAYLDKRQNAAQVLALAGSGGAVQASLAGVARDLGLVFSTVTDVAAGLKQFQAQAPNLLVVDLDGFKDGWKLIRRIRATSEFGSPKVLLVSSQGLTDKETEEAVGLGVSGCLETVAVLNAEVARLLD